MFMRYRGGGIGHKYMREIEQLYENMSRERVHHKVSKRKDIPPDKDTPVALGAKGNLPSGYIVSFLWVLKQFAWLIPSR